MVVGMGVPGACALQLLGGGWEGCEGVWGTPSAPGLDAQSLGQISPTRTQVDKEGALWGYCGFFFLLHLSTPMHSY